MTQIMTPSAESEPMKSGQIDKAVSLYRALLEKHAREFDAEAAQTVLGQSEFVDEMFAVFRKRVEMISSMVVRRVKVNRSRSPQEAIEATGRAQYTDRKVVDAMPKGEGDEAEIVFFKPDLSQRSGFISDDDLEKEFELRGLKPADPISVSAVNEADPAFADEKPHGTHWKDAKGNWCYATFKRWFGGRLVLVYRVDSGWDDFWWFAGVRK